MPAWRRRLGGKGERERESTERVSFRRQNFRLRLATPKHHHPGKKNITFSRNAFAPPALESGESPGTSLSSAQKACHLEPSCEEDAAAAAAFSFSQPAPPPPPPPSSTSSRLEAKASTRDPPLSTKVKLPLSAMALAAARRTRRPSSLAPVAGSGHTETAWPEGAEGGVLSTAKGEGEEGEAIAAEEVDRGEGKSFGFLFCCL